MEGTWTFHMLEIRFDNSVRELDPHALAFQRRIYIVR